jgi:hypothetical protein
MPQIAKAWIAQKLPTAAAIWNGEVGLYKMLWFYFFAGFVVLAIPINFVRGFGYEPQGPFWVAYSLGLVFYACFICVGTWKSADHFRGPRLVALMAKLTILLVYIIMGSGFLYGMSLALR